MIIKLLCLTIIILLLHLNNYNIEVVIDRTIEDKIYCLYLHDIYLRKITLPQASRIGKVFTY